ncbi:GntR family transcriptional regulator [Clostridiaceae bacterium M8S5]|nr:GntR family transcriptional regulator [Clostridiaceae bacterium M8S5]
MRIIISNSSSQPIYEQIVDQIKTLILQNDLEEGDALPSIRKLSRELQISVITTKRAYEILEREGFIETVRGKGSFVAPQNKELLKERKMKIIEDKLSEAVNESKMLGISLQELIDMLTILFEDI